MVNHELRHENHQVINEFVHVDTNCNLCYAQCHGPEHMIGTLLCTDSILDIIIKFAERRAIPSHRISRHVCLDVRGIDLRDINAILSAFDS